MQERPTKLNDFPGLMAWFHQHPFGEVRRTPAERFVWKTCLALTSPGAMLIRQWTTAFQELIDDGDDPQIDFLEAKEIFDDCGTGLMEFLGELGQIAFDTNQTDSFMKAMSVGADNTSMAVLRFMSAWTALNMGDLERCVADCEKVDEPFASVCTIHGQALLELGRPTEAIEVFSMAVKLDPRELIAWFQLAKAHQVMNQPRSAWMALSQCRKLAPGSPEIALFCAMVAIADDTQEQVEIAYNLLSEHLPATKGVADVCLHLLRLSIRLGDKDKFLNVVAEGDWPVLRRDSVFIRTIPGVLRDLEKLQWMDVAKDLLVAVTADIPKVI